MRNFISQPTEGILCIYSPKKDFTGEYMGVDLIFNKKLFYGKEEKISPIELKILSVIHAMMHVKKEKISSYIYINCKETIKIIDDRSFTKIKIDNEKLEKAARWMIFEKRLPHVVFWDENMWTPQYEFLKDVS